MNTYLRQILALPGAFSSTCACLLLLCALNAHAAVGTVTYAASDAQARNGAGVMRALVASSEVDNGDTLYSRSGQLQLTFTDGARLALYANTELNLERYNYSPSNSSDDSIVMELVRGTLRTITGLLTKRKPAGYAVRAQVATVGVRGTEYLLSLEDETVTAEVTEGIISLTTPLGSIELRPGEVGEVKDRQSAPRKVAATDTAPALAAVAAPRLPAERLAEASNADREIETNLSVSTGVDARDRTSIFLASPAVTANASTVGRLVLAPTTTVSGGVVSTLGGSRLGETVAESHRSNDVLWGRWFSPAGSTLYGADFPIQHHYIAGRATSAEDMNRLTLSNTSAQYALQGSTTPTTDGIADGSNVRASLNVNFSATPTAALSVAFDRGAQQYAFNAPNLTIIPNQSRITSGGIQPGDTLSINGTPVGRWNYALDGFFYGTNASHAGIIYAIANSSGTLPVRTLGSLVFCRVTRC